MRNSIFSTFALCALLTCTGCATTSSSSDMVPLEIQTMQTREYEHQKDVMFLNIDIDNMFTINNNFSHTTTCYYP